MQNLSDDERATVAAFEAMLPAGVISLEKDGLGWSVRLSNSAVVLSSNLGDALLAARAHRITPTTDTDPPGHSPA